MAKFFIANVQYLKENNLNLYLIPDTEEFESLKQTCSEIAGNFVGVNDTEEGIEDKISATLTELQNLYEEGKVTVLIDSVECCGWESYAKEPLELTAIYYFGSI